MKNKTNFLLTWMVPSFLPNNSKFPTHYKKGKGGSTNMGKGANHLKSTKQQGAKR